MSQASTVNSHFVAEVLVAHQYFESGTANTGQPTISAFFHWQLFSNTGLMTDKEPPKEIAVNDPSYVVCIQPFQIEIKNCDTQKVLSRCTTASNLSEGVGNGKPSFAFSN